jgi:hypothetical protein
VAAIAYLNWARWVADCPTPGCGNAMTVELGQSSFACTGKSVCGQTTTLQWPADPAQAAADLAGYPPSGQSQPFPEQEEA